MFTWINKDDEILTVSLESDMTLLPWFVGTESVTASTLLWFKPAGQFVRTDLAETECQELEEPSLLKTDSINEGRTSEI